MRNIRIADRKDWVTNQQPVPPSSPSPRRSRARDWLATLPILLLVPVLIFPFGAALANTPSLGVDRTTVSAGGVIEVVGDAFERREAGSLVIDPDGAQLVEYKANRRGRFRVRIVIPDTFEAGTLRIAAVDGAGQVRATVELTVGETAKPEPTPTPTPAPTATPTPAPTAAPTPTPTPAPTATPTAAPTASPTPTPRPSATSSPTPTPTPLATPRPTATPTAVPTAAAPTPRPTPTPAPAIVADDLILTSSSHLTSLPMSGSAWSSLKSRADAGIGSPNISNQDDNTDLAVLAKALVWKRTGVTTYRTATLNAIKAAVGTEAGGRTLALGRNLPGYVIAADVIGVATLDPTFDQNVFRPWLRGLLTKQLDGMTLRQTHEWRPNNWGTHAGAARAAIAGYLGDTAEMARTAQVFRGWLGDRSAYAGFSFGDTSWQCDPTRPVAINATGCSRNGVVLDGALPDEMRRGGTFAWPPAYTGYAWEAMQGATLQAELLRDAGYAAWEWSDRALLRASKFLYGRLGWVADGDDEWQPWLIDERYGTSYRSAAPARFGKNFGYTDWLYGS